MIKKIIIIIVFFLSSGLALPVSAQSQPFFGVSPTKIEMLVKPGQTKTREVKILNNLGRVATFQLSLESFTAGKDGRGVVVLPDESDLIRQYLSISTSELTLASGESAIVPVTLTVPAGRGPASIFAVLTVEANVLGQPTGAARIQSRLGTLLFINIDTNARPAGSLKSFGLLGDVINFKTDTSRSVYISYENSGNTYVNPYGYVQAFYLGFIPVKKIAVNPWFVLPGSTRTTEVALPALPYGPYRLVLQQNRGYENIIDKEQTIGFLLPSRLVTLFIVLALVAASILGRKMLKQKQ